MRLIQFTNVLALLIAIGMFCVSCQTNDRKTTHQVRSVETSGFLDNYDQLTKGEKDQALLRYADKKVKFNRYDKLIIKPVRLIASEGSDMAETSKEDLQAIANYFHASLNKKLAKDYKIVKESAPNTMVLKVALTDMSGSKVVMDTLSSLVPIGMAVNVISKITTGNSISVGSATCEMELLDATTGKRLAAVVDGRSGNKYTGKFDKWGKWTDTKDACDYWAEKLVKGLHTRSDGDYLMDGLK